MALLEEVKELITEAKDNSDFIDSYLKKKLKRSGHTRLDELSEEELQKIKVYLKDKIPPRIPKF